MVAWINFAVLVVSAVLFWFFYANSARPAALATFLIGPLYACKGCPSKHCYVGRLWAGV